VLARTLGIFLQLAASSASQAGAEAPREAPRRITVAAAANLKGALEELILAFKQQNPKAEVVATYGASGTFFAQIRNGAPFDLFLAADADFPSKIAAAGLASGPPFPYAYGKLVLWVPAASKLDLEKDGLKALLDPSVKKLAIANPAVAPYGIASLEALRAARLFGDLQEKLVLGQSVSQTAQFAQSGNAQAAMLPLSFALVAPLRDEGRFVAVPPSGYRPIQQGGVVLKGAKDLEAAQAFVAFLVGSQGRAVLQKSGYDLPPAK
jgi:molybdate transport system substrate-binding protein